MIEKFSIVRTEMKAKEERKNEDERNINYVGRESNYLTIQEITKLVELGFDIDSVTFTAKYFSCKTLENALFIITKDSETGLYHHEYLADNNSKKCKVCGDHRQNLHLAVDHNNINVNMNNGEIDTKNENEITQFNNKLHTILKQYKTLNHIENNENSDDCLDESNNKLVNHKPISKLLEGTNFIDKFKEKKSNTNILDEVKKYIVKSEEVEKVNNILVSDDYPDICEICFDAEKNEISTRKCDHLFCSSCVTSYLTKKINEAMVNF